MLKRQIDIGEYDVDLLRILKRRLLQTAHDFRLTPCEQGAIVEMSEPGGLDALCVALALLMLRDLSPFELAQIAEKLPLSTQRKNRRCWTLHTMRAQNGAPGAVRRKLKTYLEEEKKLCICPDTMRFRMPETMGAWRLCVQSAAEELMLEKRIYGIDGRASRFWSRLKPSQIRDLSLLLHPDGSCTLTDDSDARIDYEYCDSRSAGKRACRFGRLKRLTV